MTAAPASAPNIKPHNNSNNEESKHAESSLSAPNGGGPGTVTMSSTVRTSATGIRGSILLTTSYATAATTAAPNNPLSLTKGNNNNSHNNKATTATPMMMASSSHTTPTNNNNMNANQQSVNMLRQAAAAAAQGAPHQRVTTAAPSSPPTTAVVEPMQIDPANGAAVGKTILSPRGVASIPTSPGVASGVGSSESTNNSRKPATTTGGVEYMDTSSHAGSQDDGNTNNDSSSLKCRRQKRLERNRESARLSRRRRKHYLEVLEERVAQLSKEMDAGRRWHVSQAVTQVAQKRLQALQQQQQQQQAATTTVPPPIWTTVLSRTSPELRVALTFQSQQSKSFCAPPSSQLVLWLTLQNDDFFRGGRAASERLSAARIGERMLQNGNDKVTPAQTMWPLICNEIGLSYDQEEKVRMYQRTLLQDSESWLSRHTSYASKKSMDSVHTATQALALRIGNRERKTGSLLKASQMSRLQEYVKSKRQELSNKLPRCAAMPPTATNQTPPVNNKSYDLSKDQHLAANLYVLNHRLCNILKTIPSAAPLVVGPALKKLSRRPSFESLGARSGTADSNTSNSKANRVENAGESRPFSRDNTFPSTGSLKRSASEMSIDSNDTERHHRTSVDPVEAHVNAQETIQKHLGHVKEIIPKANVPSMAMVLPPADRASGILPIHTTSSTPSPPPAVTSSSSPSSSSEQHNTGFVPMSSIEPVDPAIETFEMIAGEPLPDPVPMSVLSSTPAPAFMTPVAPMPAAAPAPTTNAFAAPVHPGAPVGPAAPATNPFLTTIEPRPPTAGGMPPTHVEEPEPKQPRRAFSSFFPPALGVVPEEMWSNEAAEDFLMNFVDEDWAIGQGVDTDF
eukprot:CAMPEP_0168741832 /NCGR_PEP_ID=MMETSP0724-20121128/12724_1 /TAXON_ID=265536 /ORGANISM="Amphiprora sp., Strain CCMP467" /LENGTH=851 /DNA_ID=CAMNT_0008789363 /DNA_START=218 /DNA_END=2773 /DNA_ORIENTATION=-